MPNWCENDLQIRFNEDDPKQVKEFERFRIKAKGKNGILDFNKFIPYPKKYSELDKKAKEHNKKNPKKHITDGYNSGGYEWCIKNWGTKWNAKNIQLNKEYEGKWLLKFETAWSPPIYVIKKIASEFPNINFCLTYFECGRMFNGVFIIKGTKIISEEMGRYYGRRGG